MDAIAIPETATISAKDHVVSTTAGGEVVILDPSASRYYSLDGVGEFVWTKIQGGIGLAALRDAVVSYYDVDPDVALSDLKALLRELTTVGLVDVRDATPR